MPKRPIAYQIDLPGSGPVFTRKKAALVRLRRLLKTFSDATIKPLYSPEDQILPKNHFGCEVYGVSAGCTVRFCAN